MTRFAAASDPSREPMIPGSTNTTLPRELLRVAAIFASCASSRYSTSPKYALSSARMRARTQQRDDLVFMQIAGAGQGGRLDMR